MRADRRSLSRTMISRYSCRFSSLVTRPLCSISPNMRTSASGVFSSWLTLATKSLFRRETRRSRSAVRRMVTIPARMTAHDSVTRPSSHWRRVCTLLASSSLWSGETWSRQLYKVVGNFTPTVNCPERSGGP